MWRPSALRASIPARAASPVALGLLLACALATVLAASEAPLRVKVRVGGVGDLLVPFSRTRLVGDLAADVER